MQRALYDMLYLVTCGIHQVSPKRKRLESLDFEKIYKVSCFHSLEALVGMILKNAGIALSKKWLDDVSKAIRKEILFDAERAKILGFMESEGIWYLPLKGIVIKELYPAIGMRQMSDNDILFDGAYADVMQKYMIELGYEATSVGKGNHDVYIKLPVYNFELHIALYGAGHDAKWSDYYEKVKERLIKNKDSEYGYHFSDEDFYVYMITHEYKHYKGSGTGLRSLLDVYLYLKSKEQTLDFNYIQKECDLLGIAEFEKQGRNICKKIFSKDVVEGIDDICNLLSLEENEMLKYYLTSGVYGTTDRMIENRIHKFQKETGSSSKFQYVWNRLFPGMEKYKEFYPFFYKHQWLLPIGWLYRTIRACFDSKRRKDMQKEIQVVTKLQKE